MTPSKISFAEKLVGAQPYEAMEKFMAANRVGKRKDT